MDWIIAKIECTVCGKMWKPSFFNWSVIGMISLGSLPGYRFAAGHAQRHVFQ